MDYIIDDTKEGVDIMGDITRQYLIDSYDAAAWVGDKKVLKALRRTIKYMSTSEQWKNFKEMWDE